MGLDFDGSSAGWSYIGFHRFRARVAREIEVVLDKMDGFGGSESWDPVKGDPIIYLLDHSDCDGELTPEQCRVVAPRLRELIQYWPEDYDKVNAIALAEGMESCAKRNKPLRFC
jgi:hypothetical protein